MYMTLKINRLFLAQTGNCGQAEGGKILRTDGSERAEMLWKGEKLT